MPLQREPPGEMTYDRLSAYNARPQMMARLTALGRTNMRLSTHQMRLATGSRLNRAEDDSAYMTIAAKLGGKVRGQVQALANIGDAKSMLNVAEGSLNSIMDILLSMKGKAVQAINDAYASAPPPEPPPGNGNGNGGGNGGGNGNGNGGGGGETVATPERDAIHRELVAHSNEITQILDESRFNGTALFSEAGTTLAFNTAATPNGNFLVSVDAISTDLLAISEGDLVVSDNDSASVVLANIDSAIETVAGMYSNIGNSQKRLTLKHDNLTNVHLVKSATRSRIQDADFAREQMQIVRLQILQHRGLAYVAQANTTPENVKPLFG